jgi:Uma2 family endonuclease
MTTAPPTRHRFTVADYQRLGEAGILTEDDRVELIAGEIIAMTPIGPKHLWCLNRLTYAAVRAVGDRASVSVQNPIRLADDGEPQPDLAVLRRQDGQDTVPTGADVLLVIEVADTSLAYDRGVKLPLYAAAGIPEAWLMDLAGEKIERHSDPGPAGYRSIAIAGRGEALNSTVLPALTLAADAVLGPAAAP